MKIFRRHLLVIALFCLVHADAITQDSAASVVKKALQFGPIRDLYNTAAATPGSNGKIGTYKLKIVQKTESGFDAECCSDSREIRVRADMSDEHKLSSFVFELINAKTDEKFRQLEQSAVPMKMSVEEFARAAEKIEFENGIEHRRIMRRCGLGAAYNIWGKQDFRDFDTFWQRELQHSAHADYWRDVARSHKRVSDIVGIGDIVYVMEKLRPSN